MVFGVGDYFKIHMSLSWKVTCRSPSVSLVHVLRPSSTSCQDILLWFLSHSDTEEALWVLQQLSGLQAAEQQAAASLSFRPGSEGGARLCVRESCRYGWGVLTSQASC